MHNQDQPLIFELSKPGRIGYSLPEMDVPELDLATFFLMDIYVKKSLNFLKFLSLILCVIILLFQKEIMVLIQASTPLALVQ